MVSGMDILLKLIANPGLVHLAEHVVSFLDDKSVAQCRRVSKSYNVFLKNIWRKRAAVKAARKQCEIKYRVMTHGRDEVIETSIFESWPEWKVALNEIHSLKDLHDVTYLLKEYIKKARPSNPRDYKTCCSLLSPPLNFIIDLHKFIYKGEGKVEKLFKTLLKTSLDFNTLDDRVETPLHSACALGSKELVKLLLDHAERKGINVKAVNDLDETVVHAALQNEGIVKYLFERRHEFDLDITQVVDTDNILHRGAFWIKDIEDMEALLKWAIEQGINVSDVNSDNRNILHFACDFNHNIALFLLESCEKYGLDQIVLASMANVIDQSIVRGQPRGKRPIDLVKDRLSEKSLEIDSKLANKLITKLEKYTV